MRMNHWPTNRRQLLGSKRLMRSGRCARLSTKTASMYKDFARLAELIASGKIAAALAA
jgi:hypothetical protein